MSINDICELGSILQGDDQDRIELERNIMSVETTIQQQELRLQYEEDQRQKMEEIHESLSKKAEALNSTLDSFSNVLNQMIEEGVMDVALGSFLFQVSEYELSRDLLLNEVHSVLESVTYEEGNVLELSRLDEEVISADTNLIETEYNEKSLSFMKHSENAYDGYAHLNLLETSIQHSTSSRSSENSNLMKEMDERQTIYDNRLLNKDKSLIDIDDASREESNVQTRIIENNTTLSSMQAQYDIADHQVKTFSTELDIVNIELDNLEYKNSLDEKLSIALASEILALVNTKANLSLQIQKHKQSSDIAFKHERDLEMQYARENMRLKSYAKRRDELNVDVQRVSEELHAQISLIESISAEISSLQAKLRGESEDISNALESLRKSNTKKSELWNQILNLREANRQKNEEVFKLDTSINESNSEIKRELIQNKALRVESETLKIELSKFKEKFDILKDENELEWKLSETRREIESLNEKKTIASEKMTKSQNEINILAKENEKLISKRHSEAQIERASLYRETKEFRIAVAKARTKDKITSSIQELRDHLIEKDKAFKHSFFKADSELKEAEISVLRELKDLDSQLQAESNLKATMKPFNDELSSEFSKSLSSKSIKRFHLSPRATLQRNASLPNASTSQRMLNMSSTTEPYSQENLKKKRKFVSQVSFGSAPSESEPVNSLNLKIRNDENVPNATYGPLLNKPQVTSTNNTIAKGANMRIGLSERKQRNYG